MIPLSNRSQSMLSDKRSARAGFKRNLTQKIYNAVREMIVNCEFARGQRLVFSDMARQLRVSRTPVNNALAILAKEGFLDFTPNQGYSIHKTTETEAKALYDILNLYCVGSLRDAIGNLTHQHIAELEKRKTDYEKAVVEQRHRLRFLLDLEFHAYLIQLSGNAFMTNHFREAYQKLCLWSRFDGLQPERARQIVWDHHDIVTAVRRRDVERAKTLLAKHIEDDKIYVFSFLQSERQYPLGVLNGATQPSSRI